MRNYIAVSETKRSKTRVVQIALIGGIAVCTSAALVTAIWFFDMKSYKLVAYARAHYVARTEGELRSLAGFVQDTVKATGKQPPVDNESLSFFLRHHVPEYKEFLVDRAWTDPNTGMLIDAARKRLEVIADSPRKYRLVAAGFNGKFEHGKGDDIVYEFNPWELADANDANNPSD